MTTTTSRAARAKRAPRKATAESAAQPTITVVNASTGATAGVVDLMGADDVSELVDRARTAQPAWEALGVAGRVKVMDRFRLRLIEHRELVTNTLMAESGKTWEDCNADLMVVAMWAQQFSNHAPEWLADEPVRSASPLALGRRNTIVRRARGVVGVIGPWNVPLSLTIGDALPALLAGNAVVCKPSEITPLSSLLAAKLFLEAGGPADVLTVATGDGTTGAALVELADYIHFTGSVATGRRIAERAGALGTPVSLELGGKDPMVVLADADLERAAAAAVHYAFFNTGQVCMSVERVYVDRRVHDRFVELVVARLARVSQGVSSGRGTADITAMIHPPQMDIVRNHVADALAKGARVVAGGRTTTGPGMFHEATVLVDVDHTMECMTEETFGPTMPIMAFDDVEHAVTLANDSKYGLTASVWTTDLDRGEAVARRIDAGTVTVNDAMFHLGDVTLPMGGWKDSGLGARNGREGLTRFTRQQVIQVAHTIGQQDPTWMPYDARTSRLVELTMARLTTLPRIPTLPSLPSPRSIARAVRRVLP